MADALALRSLCDRDRVGALIVDRSGKVIGEGYNGPPWGFTHGNDRCSVWCQRTVNAHLGGSEGLHAEYWDCPALHAEANALMMSDRSLRAGGMIYVTSHICMSCAKLIANSGLRFVVVRSSDQAHRNPGASYRFLQDCSIDVKVHT